MNATVPLHARLDAGDPLTDEPWSDSDVRVDGEPVTEAQPADLFDRDQVAPGPQKQESPTSITGRSSLSLPISVAPTSHGLKRLPGVKTTAERALDLGSHGEPLSTGIAVLDGACRGGFRMGDSVVLGGAPGAGKTTLMAQLALRWARAGLPVVFLAVDEDADGAVMRFGQALGFGLEALEATDPTARMALNAALKAMPNFLVLDGLETDLTVEGAAAALPDVGPFVFCADSLQTVRACGTDDAADLRLRTNAVVGALKAIARRGGLTVATSELARASYRGVNPRDRINDLAAFKESGGIEYGGNRLLVLRETDEDGIVDVAVVKNRRARSKFSFQLRLDRVRATFSETTAEADGSPGGKATGDASDIEAVRQALRCGPAVRNRQELVNSLRGMSKDRRWKAVRALKSEIENSPVDGVPRLFLREHSPGTPGEQPSDEGDGAPGESRATPGEHGGALPENTPSLKGTGVRERQTGSASRPADGPRLVASRRRRARPGQPANPGSADPLPAPEAPAASDSEVPL